MSGAFKTVADDKLVTKNSNKNKVNDGVQTAADTVLTVPTVTYGTQVEDYSPYLVQMHEAKKQAAKAELKAAYDNSMAELARAETGLAEGYQAARNETAGAHEVERRSFAEYAAANGLNNGAAGQAELARGVTLHNNMNGIRTAEANAMADLTLQRAQAENEYNAAIAQAEYTGEYQLAAALYEEKVRVQEALIDAEIRQQQAALERYQLQYQAQRDVVADQQNASKLALEQAAQALKEKDQADSYALGQAAQALKEKEQADSHALGQAAQALKEKEQADELELAWQKQTDAVESDRVAQNLAQRKYDDSQSEKQKEQLAAYGEMYLKAGIMPSEEMRDAMGITAADAHKYILALKSSPK